MSDKIPAYKRFPTNQPPATYSPEAQKAFSELKAEKQKRRSERESASKPQEK